MQDKKIAILVPTRSRPEIFLRLLESWEKTTSRKSQLMPIIDSDQVERYDKALSRCPEAFVCSHREGIPTLVRKLNIGAGAHIAYPIISFMGDDCVFQTADWEDQIINWQEKNKGICYCNDQLQEGSLPNNVFIHSEWIEALGFMAPPVLNHYYIDNYWMDLGLRLRKLKYFHDIVIEHRHWSNGKAEKDDTYQNAESKFMQQDQIIWDLYRGPGGGLDQDVSKIIKHQNL